MFFELFSLTGGIACGKSTVSTMLKELGATIIDVDLVVRSVQEPGCRTLNKIFSIWPEVKNANGTLNREKLGEIIFANKTEKVRLERLMMAPTLGCIVQQIVLAWWHGADVILLDHPYLFETKIFVYLSAAIAVVYVNPDVQLRRLIQRNGYTEEHAKQRINGQMPLAVKLKKARWRLDNNGSQQDTRAEVQTMYRQMQQMARKCRIVRRFLCVVTTVSLLLVWKAI